MDVNKLLQALDDETNEPIFNYTTKKMQEMNLKVLQELKLSHEDTLDFLSKLRNYRYVDEMDELKYGTYLRWIPLSNPNDLQLTKGAIFCEVKITDDGVHLVCKNYGYNKRFFQIKLDENLVFQRLTDQEQVLLSALDHLSK
jgi:hypothetical protein